MATILKFAVVFGTPVLLALLLCVPLLIYVLRQRDRRRLLVWGAAGTALGGGAAAAYLAWLTTQATGGFEDFGLVGLGLLALFAGCLIGAHLGVALARMVSEDADQRSRARRGARNGLVAGLALTALLVLVGVPLAIGPYVALLAAGVGAILGARTRTSPREDRSV